MAIIAISRQVAALGDEVASAAAEKLGYRFVRRQELEQRIVSLGFPAGKLHFYDERKPGFLASLAKGRDEYLNYLQTAVLEAAEEGNCILIGRGAFVILETLPNLIALRFIANDQIRMERLQKEFSWNEKQARQRISESGANRHGFQENFFNIDVDDPSHYSMVVNTGIFTVDSASDLICFLTKTLISEEKEREGKARLAELVKCQHLVNTLVLERKLNIEFLRALISDGTLILQGVADSSAVIEQAVRIASTELPEYPVKSAISIVRGGRGDFIRQN